MRPSICAVCTQAVGPSTDSREHIIPNALGGRSRVRGFICRSCNNGIGSNWDRALEAQLRPIALLFGVRRQDGKATRSELVETASGAKHWLNADGSLTPAEPPYRETVLPGGRRQIEISAPSTSAVLRRLKEVCDKHPHLDFGQLAQSARSQVKYLDEPVKMSWEFGGELAGRSIVKSALCLASSRGFDAERSEAHSYLRHEPIEAPFGYFYARDLIRNRPPMLPLHCVGISSRGTDGQLLGYVEYFGFRRMVVKVAGSYSGPEIHGIYAINPASGRGLDLDVDLQLSRSEVDACFAYQCIPDGAVEAIVDELMPQALKRGREREFDRVFKRAWHTAMTACGVKPGDELPRENFQEFIGHLMTGLEPYVLHLLQRRRIPPRPMES